MNDRPDKGKPEMTDGITKVLNAARSSIVDKPMTASEMMSAIQKDSSTLTCRICHVHPCICPDDRIDAIRAQSETTDRERCAPTAVFVLDKVIALVQSDMPKQNALAWLFDERRRLMEKCNA